ncbi:hypothetical protein [uncultured Aquimarina sp.]|uniref:hypothetical protein n=1 Tax=uncultured Aquimarina sp. TaxID=575652 RepID=UPI0026278F2F|nr:hypothetical protein [uncultured Aquimarina sp.]
MKKYIFLITAFTIIKVVSQEQKTIFQPEFAPFTIQCEKIGRAIVDKNSNSIVSEWYEGEKLNEKTSLITQLESDIDASKLEVTYYLILINEEIPAYTFHFFNEKTKEEFGQLFLLFKNRDNVLIDDIKLVDKAGMEKIKSESDKNNKFKNIPPPPPPPSIIKN